MRQDKKVSILQKNIHPVKQAIGVAIIIISLNIIAQLVNVSGINIGEMNAWEISLTCILFFALGNALFFLNAPDKNLYWRNSIFSYTALVIFSILIAWLISGRSLNESGSVKWIYFVFTFGYLVFISIIGMMRKIVEIVIKQDKKLRGEE